MVGELFIESLAAFPFVLVIGYFFSYLLRGRDIGFFTAIVNILTFIGVFFHEISHYAFCLITRVPAGKISVKLRYAGYVNPHGSITPDKPYQLTFLQSMLVGLGPVLIGTWIIYFSLKVALSSLFDPLYRIIAGLLVVAVLLASTPSAQDFHMMKEGFNNDPKHSFYQIILLLLSLLLAWGIVILLSWQTIEFLYYITIIIWYFILKYSFIGIRGGFDKIRTRFGKEQYETRFRRFSRRRYKSSKFK